MLDTEVYTMKDNDNVYGQIHDQIKKKFWNKKIKETKKLLKIENNK